MHDLTTPEGVQQYMLLAQNADDWNDRCTDVKRVNEGYPSFWYTVIIRAGIIGRVQAKWENK